VIFSLGRVITLPSEKITLPREKVSVTGGAIAFAIRGKKPLPIPREGEDSVPREKGLSRVPRLVVLRRGESFFSLPRASEGDRAAKQGDSP